MKKEMQILDAVETVFNLSEGCKLQSITFELLKDDLSILEKAFSCSKIEAFFIANIFCLNLEDKWLNINDLKKHFDCKIIDLIKLNVEFYGLINNKYIEVDDYDNLGAFLDTHVNFKSNNEIIEKILNYSNVNLDAKANETNKYSFVEEMYKTINNSGFTRIRNHKVKDDVFEKVDKICTKYTNHPLHVFFEKNDFDKECKLMFSHILWEYLLGRNGEYPNVLCDLIYGENAKSVEKFLEIMDEDHFLLNNKYLCFEKQMFGRKELVFTKKSLKTLAEIDFSIHKDNKIEHLHIIKVENIHQQNLFYNDKSAAQINQIQNVLEEDTLNKIQNNLSKKGLPKGITSIFYGPPGTGKTETVLQLAKASNRNIMKVDISETKSMWFGESQKLIKGIFDDYKELCKECNEIPILFFNEADAVFASRSSAGFSAVSQTQNEIQNILLEELENFEGILMATTNLEGNLDTAFDRRFLYKIEMAKPNISAKAKIWSTKIKKLSEEKANLLVTQFDFSGGQINNVVRKIEMYEILNDTSVSFEEILIYCEEESFTKEKIRVGFKK